MKNSLRISGGTLKGKKIPFDFKESLRPTSSKLKEILFNWLQFEINECVCLDLFAGTGSLGIEALSRGSSKVIFVELNKKNYSSLSVNLKKLDVKDKSKIFFKDAFTWIRNYDLSEIDLIFLDPPFNKEHEVKALKLLMRKNDLKSSCKIYLEYSKYDEIEIPKEFKVLKEKSVGDVKALLLIKNEN
jgi:16S rRNA (guanine966-N2)-methyltransferase